MGKILLDLSSSIVCDDVDIESDVHGGYSNDGQRTISLWKSFKFFSLLPKTDRTKENKNKKKMNLNERVIGYIYVGKSPR